MVNKKDSLQVATVYTYNLNSWKEESGGLVIKVILSCTVSFKPTMDTLPPTQKQKQNIAGTGYRYGVLHVFNKNWKLLWENK